MRIVTHLKAGAYLAHAAEAAGVSRQAVYNWIKRGADTGDEPFASFAQDVMQAQAEDAVRNQHLISKAAAGGDWKAAAWNLERKHPKLYGPRSSVALSGDEDGAPVKIDLAPLSMEELLALKRAAEK